MCVYANRNQTKNFQWILFPFLTNEHKWYSVKIASGQKMLTKLVLKEEIQKQLVPSLDKKIDFSAEPHSIRFWVMQIKVFTINHGIKQVMLAIKISEYISCEFLPIIFVLIKKYNLFGSVTFYYTT